MVSRHGADADQQPHPSRARRVAQQQRPPPGILTRSGCWLTSHGDHGSSIATSPARTVGIASDMTRARAIVGPGRGRSSATNLHRIFWPGGPILTPSSRSGTKICNGERRFRTLKRRSDLMIRATSDGARRTRSRRADRASLMTLFQAWRSGHQLDLELAAGADPNQDPVRQERARELTHRGMRLTIATDLEEALVQADRRGTPSPPSGPRKLGARIWRRSSNDSGAPPRSAPRASQEPCCWSQSQILPSTAQTLPRSSRETHARPCAPSIRGSASPIRGTGTRKGTPFRPALARRAGRRSARRRRARRASAATGVGGG